MRKPETIEKLYLDFDGFFASVMQQAMPELRGRPVGVIPFETSAAHSTMVIACSKEAKRRLKSRIEPQRFPLVMIYWLDSCDIAGWKRLDSWPGVRTLQCVSVGYLIGEDAHSKTISPHLAYPDDETNTSGAGIMVIPTRAITKLTVLSSRACRA
jgi:hypothetical protein